MKKIFWIFRTNLRNLESYHIYNKLEDFENNCWDFYLLQGIEFLKSSYFDEVIIWRLNPKNKIMKDIIFDINNKKFIQRWVNSFDECFKFQKPIVSFFRGGFPEYCQITKKNKNFFGLKLYLAAGNRIKPQYGGFYDIILVEDNNDIYNKKCYPFYKTSNSKIFYPQVQEKKYDICWIANFTQITQKGQEHFISSISKSNFLKNLRIIHIGNKPELAKNISNKYKVNNIKFYGYQKDRKYISKIINQSKFGIITSNRLDGNPRVIFEFLSTGTPLIIRDKTRLFDYYKKNCIIYSDSNIENKIKFAMNNYDNLKISSLSLLQNISIKKISKKNNEIITKNLIIRGDD